MTDEGIRSPSVSRPGVLKFDGAFLLLSGGSAMIAETVGHFSGSGPMAKMKGRPTPSAVSRLMESPLFRVCSCTVRLACDRSLWHQVGRAVHLLLAGSNLLYWSSFREMTWFG